MSDVLDRIAADPDWIPHRLDWPSRTIEFVRVPRDRLTGPGFLFEYQPATETDRALVPVSALGDLAIETVPAHFIFHTAFCRSTLLVGALNIDGVSIGLSEPGIIADLSAAGRDARELIAPVVRLLARRRKGIDAVFIKPTNHSNRLIPDLLNVLPDAQAILMTNPVSPFLQSVRKRGLMGHRWGRRLYLELQGYSPVDFGMPPEEVFAMTDLQVAGAAWLLNQNYFTRLLASPLGPRLRSLDGDDFNRRRGGTIASVLEFCGLSGPEPAALAENPVFDRHSKLGGAVAEDSADGPTREEIAQVSQWLGLIADQMGLSLPLRQTLL